MTGFKILVDERLKWTKDDVKSMLCIRLGAHNNGFNYECGLKVSMDDMGALVIELNDKEGFMFNEFKFDEYSNLIEEVEN